MLISQSPPTRIRPGHRTRGVTLLVSRAKVKENQVMLIQLPRYLRIHQRNSQLTHRVIPKATPIIPPTIPPSPDYTPVSPDYSPASDLESDLSEDPSSDHIPPLPAISPFLSSDDLTPRQLPIIPCRRVMILAPGQPIPHGRPYRYHLNGPVHMMTARKMVGPLPNHRLAVRHSANHNFFEIRHQRPSSEYFNS
ncbi:hypothetical protein Tco_0088632 [Tanacetum coccineum]